MMIYFFVSLLLQFPLPLLVSFSLVFFWGGKGGKKVEYMDQIAPLENPVYQTEKPR
jgi:hypothetical protein